MPCCWFRSFGELVSCSELMKRVYNAPATGPRWHENRGRVRMCCVGSAERWPSVCRRVLPSVELGPCRNVAGVPAHPGIGGVVQVLTRLTDCYFLHALVYATAALSLVAGSGCVLSWLCSCKGSSGVNILCHANNRCHARVVNR